jgi:predicted nucleotidyltransferase
VSNADLEVIALRTRQGRAILALREEGFFAEAFRLVILFGSVARGTASEDSDVDLGVLGSGVLSLADELALQARLEQRLACRVDLVRLDLADPMLRWRVARDGVVLHADPPAEAARFLAQAAIEHDEMAPLIEEATRRFTARLARRAP